MGISYNAAIVIGRPRDDFGELGLEAVQPFIDDGVLEDCPSCFDSTEDEDIIGIIIEQCSDTPREIKPNEPEPYHSARERFYMMTGLEAKVYITRLVY